MALPKYNLVAVLLLVAAALSTALHLHRSHRPSHPAGHDPRKLLDSPERLAEGFDVRVIPQVDTLSATGGGSCANTGARPVTAPKKNLWFGLTSDEDKSARDYIKKKVYPHTTAFLFDLSLLNPNKSTALSYLDGNGAQPPRYAQGTLLFLPEFAFRFIMVGPLPVQPGKTTWSYLTYPFAKESKGRIQLAQVTLGDPFYNLAKKYAMSVADIMKTLGWGAYTGHEKNNTIFLDTGRQITSADGKKTYQWLGFGAVLKSEFDYGTLAPLGLYFGFDVSPQNGKKYKFLGWLYNGELFPTTKAFRTAFSSHKIPRLEAPSLGGDWAITDQHGPKKPLDHLYPPTSVAPAGSRYEVDEGEKYVKWMDFEFFFAFYKDTGLRLFDIRYKGKRIIYELGMDEALAVYASNDPLQGTTAYFDTASNFGDGFDGLVPEYDCPSYATYFGISTYHGKERKKPVICLFEMDAGYPLSRHSWGVFTSNVKNIYFTIRSISTIGNYDYLTDYQFYMDGSIRVQVRASGYIEASYYAANEDYGYKIHEALSGGMHDHDLVFKADFDIMGVENSMQAVEVVPTTETYPWAMGAPRNTMKLEKRIIASEDESKLLWGSNGVTSYVMTNQDMKNKYGEAPGYRIYPEGAVHLVAHHSSNLANGADFTSHDLFVTKQKDTEPRACSGYNGYDVDHPLVRFNDFFDGESLEQTDLVTWFNLGMHHVPNTQDLPNTVFTTAKSSVLFAPVNYNLPGNPSVETVNMVRIPRSGKAFLFGQDQGSCSINYESQTQFGSNMRV